MLDCCQMYVLCVKVSVMMLVILHILDETTDGIIPGAELLVHFSCDYES